MSAHPAFDRCLTFINSQLRPAHPAVLLSKNGARWHAVTISRESGSGAHIVAEKLAAILQLRTASPCPWTVFDRNLVERVLEDHHLPGRIAAFMPEDRAPAIEDTLEDLFGLHPPAEALVQKTSETILHLAELGNVILIGRGANILTRKMHDVFHVRLVAPLDRRIEYVQQHLQLSKKAAVEFVLKEDRGRQRYVRTYFREESDNPLLYHLVINTGMTGYDKAAELIADAIFPISLLVPLKSPACT